MGFLEITLVQIMYGLITGMLILGGIAMILALISLIIDWTWWKKEYRKDLRDWKYFVEHRQEILDCINKRNLKTEAAERE